MPRGAVLGRVDLAARKQPFAPFRETALGGEVGEEAQGHRAEALARIIEPHAARFGAELPVTRQKAAQVHAAPALGVLRELRPRRALERRAGVHFSRRYRR